MNRTMASQFRVTLQLLPKGQELNKQELAHYPFNENLEALLTLLLTLQVV
jgi:hypothetical protein